MANRKKSTFERLTNGQLNRKQRREWMRKLSAEDPGLEIVNRNVAGIDVGNESHFVAVPVGRDAQPVQEFGSWTADLERMADWLKDCGIETVVMQSTGVYWIALFDVLEARGFIVRSALPMHAIRRTCRDARAMFRRANGYKSCIPTVCSGIRFGHPMRSGHCAVCGACATVT
jgi:hypothetical protein